MAGEVEATEARPRCRVMERVRETGHVIGVKSMVGRPRKYADGFRWPPIRQWWREINRRDRADVAQQRADQKARDKRRKKRRKCQCDAYKFPHRPGGGLCRSPEPPLVRWQDAQAAEIAARVAKFRELYGEPDAEQMADLIGITTRPPRRRHCDRYAGILRQIARNSGLHPVRDRDLIKQLMPQMLFLAKQLKRQNPRVKFRNMRVFEKSPGVWSLQGEWTTAGPTM
jgi:hypothetical protein